jgi:hypothetical protein
LSDGRLLFEPDEAEEIHKGTVGMLKGNANLNVLTSYADVDAITSKTTADTTDTSLSKMKGNIYSQGSTSEQIFNAEGSVGLEAGLKVNISFMMMFANKAATYITNLINKKFANGNITFKYTILPISYHNDVKFAESAFKYVGSGYSLIMPALAFGLSQRDLVNIKDLENTLLKLNEKLIPPSTSYTQTANGDSNEPGATGTPVETDINVGGRPNKEEGEKTETTIETQQSRN